MFISFLEARNKFRAHLSSHPEELVQVNRTSSFLNLSVYEQSNNFVELL